MIDLTHGRRPSIALPSRTVALTFDDGPDPTWTPQILAVLAKYHVPGTFFVVGSSVARDPELVRQIRAQGSEIGIHTFTHPDLAEVSTDRGRPGDDRDAVRVGRGHRRAVLPGAAAVLVGARRRSTTSGST